MVLNRAKAKLTAIAIVATSNIINPSLGQASDYSFASISGLIEQRVGEIVLPKIYASIGIKITINPLPARRAQLMATEGTLDGEIMRIWTYGEENLTTIRVPTPYYKLETTAFVRSDSNIAVQNKGALAGYKIAKVAGVKHTTNITEGLTNVFDVGDTLAVMRMVHKKRMDIGLTNTTDGLQVINNLGLKDIVHLTPPLATLDLYHYIHEDHRNLIPKIDRAILALKKSGDLDKLIKAAEAALITN